MTDKKFSNYISKKYLHGKPTAFICPFYHEKFKQTEPSNKVTDNLL